MTINDIADNGSIIGIADAVFQNRKYAAMLESANGLYPDDVQFQLLLDNKVESNSQRKPISYQVIPYSNFEDEAEHEKKIEIIFEYFYFQKSIRAISSKTDTNQAKIRHIIKFYK